MEKSFIHWAQDALLSWYKKTDDRTKLQHSYIVIALVVLVIAGVVGLANYQYGQALLQLALLALGAFLVNAFVWALLQSFVFTRLSTKSRQIKRK